MNQTANANGETETKDDYIGLIADHLDVDQSDLAGLEEATLSTLKMLVVELGPAGGKTRANEGESQDPITQVDEPEDVHSGVFE